MNRPRGTVGFSIACIDRKRTKVQDDDWTPRSNGTFMVLYPYVLMRKAIEPHCVFRIAEAPIHLVVREDLKSAIEAGGFTGCRFVEYQVSG